MSAVGHECNVCTMEYAEVYFMPCCLKSEYKLCDVCVGKIAKRKVLKCPQCRTEHNVDELSKSASAPTSGGDAATSAGGEEDDLQVALAASMLAYEEEKKSLETSEAEWQQNLDAALRESMCSLEKESKNYDEEKLEEDLRAALAASEEDASKFAAEAAAEAAKLEKALKRSQRVRSREDDEFDLVMKESKKLAKVEIPAAKRARASASASTEGKAPEFPRYKLIRSRAPFKAGGRGSDDVPLMTTDGRGLNVPVDVSIKAALELSLKPQQYFKREREREEAGDVCCGGDLSKPCGSSCPFLKK